MYTHTHILTYVCIYTHTHCVTVRNARHLMCVYILIYICMCVYIYVCIHTHAHVQIYVHTHTHSLSLSQMYIHLYSLTNVFTHTFVCVCERECVCTYVHVYENVYFWWRPAAYRGGIFLLYTFFFLYTGGDLQHIAEVFFQLPFPLVDKIFVQVEEHLFPYIV